MMQLLCNGQTLDLYADAGMQFTHDNPLFAFDELKCERTTNFKIPSTPKNDAVFGLSRMPATYGLGMRRKYAAELQMGAIVKKGYLYVSEYDGKDYGTIFVTGELVGLQRVKDAGKIRDIICPLDTTEYGQMADAGDNAGVWWKGLKYKQEEQSHPTALPSIRLQDTITECCSALGIPVTLPSDAGKYRYIPFEIKHYTKEGAKFAAVQAVPSSPDYKASNIVDWYKVFEPCLIPIYDIYAEVVYYDNPHSQQHGYCFYYEQPATPVCYVQGWRARMTAYVYGGDNARYYLRTRERSTGEVGVYHGGYGYDEGSADINNICDIDAFGHKTRSYDGVSEYFEVQPGDEFCFLDYEDVHVLKTDPTPEEEGQTFKVAEFAHNGVRYADGGQPSYSIPYDVTTGYKAFGWDENDAITFTEYEHGDTIDLFSSLPDCTLIDLLKAVAYMSGKVLNYSDANGITFEDLDMSGYATKAIDTLTKRGTLSRTFSNYAQHNLVTFESDETLYAFERLQASYAIDNDNIEDEKELGKVFASEGSAAYGTNGDTNVYVYMRNAIEQIKKPTLAMAESGVEYMTRVALPMCEGLQALCDASTQIKVSVHMSALEYELITAKTLLLVDGVKYIWTSRSWQKEEAQFTLAKVP